MNSEQHRRELNCLLIPEVFPFFDKSSNTFSYIVKDPDSDACAVIDTVLDFDYASGKVSHELANQIIAYIKDNDLSLKWLIETHVHADHISAAPYIQDALGGKLGISEHIAIIQETFGKVFNEGTDFERDGSQFDYLFKDGDEYQIGNLQAFVLHTPGHTPACMTHVIGDAAFVGDTLFMPDGGTARADFPGGDARTLYQSIQKVLDLPDKTRLFMCHDYGPNNREFEYQTTVAMQRAHNIHVKSSIDEKTFVDLRETRDKTLGMPRLIFPSLQINMRAGHFPEAESNQKIYLKVPINAFD
ncbi:MAG: MBL fold metallo-hydrolase [Gammaproteobacteria bacterium]